MFGGDWKSTHSSAYAIVVITLLAPALGGSTALWAQATLSCVIGLLFILAPPERSLGRLLNILFIAIGAAALVAFLPANLFGLTDWRVSFLKFGIQLPGTQSPQPWLTLESSCLLWLGLAWTYYLFSYEWPPELRETAWDIFCFGILCLAATLVISYTFKLRIPFWPNAPEFGFFPNRNQTSNVLGLGGIMIYANAFQHLQRGRRRGWMWMAGLALVCWALILNYSRAGIILFFAGALIWHLWWLLRSGSRETAPRAIAWGPLAILLALLLVAGGDTLIRFKQSADFFSAAENGRFLLQRDAFELFKTAPVVGIGLGNFRSLFSAYRRFFVSPSEAIHPESDWVWVAVEMGCLVPLGIFIGLIVWVRRCFPLAVGTWRGMRTAAMICGIGFAVHGFVDVSGHRLGALWPALFLAGMAMNPQLPFAGSAALRMIFRVLGLCFAALAVWWFASILNSSTPPTSATVERLVKEIQPATAAERYQQLLALTSEGLHIAPLNWIFYYNRGVAEAALSRPSSEVTRDFSAARYLMPNWPDLYRKEGFVWISVAEPDLAFDTWKEGLRRLENAPAFYADLYGFVRDDAELRDRWLELGRSDPRFLPTMLQVASPVEFRLELERLLSNDPELQSLTAKALKSLFQNWYQKGDRLGLAETLHEHPQWQKIAWVELARAYADNQDYRQAYETAARFCVRPQVPQIAGQSIDSLVRRFEISKNIENDGLAVAIAQANAGELDNALATLKALSAMPDPPRSLYYIEAEILARKGEWQEAWEAITKYQSIND
jgi:tetratricopeptide (TPR) repeat protein